MTTIDIAAALSTPPEGYVWEFSEDSPTWLQTDSIHDADAFWYLTNKQGSSTDDPAYHIEVKPTAPDILRVLAQVADKPWTDKKQLLEALLPAIRSVAYKS